MAAIALMVVENCGGEEKKHVGLHTAEGCKRNGSGLAVNDTQ
jgi:hypothetical protein